MKKAVSFTLDAANLLWLKGQATASDGTVSGIVNRLVTEARLGGRPRSEGAQSAAHAAQQVAWRRCERLPNVHFVGELPALDVFAALRRMDANVICNRSDDGWWLDAYPLKFHEYLAAGRPVVATPLASIECFSGVAEFAAGIEAWMAALAHAIEGGGVGTEHVRLSYANSRENLQEALGRIGSFVDGLGRG